MKNDLSVSILQSPSDYFSLFNAKHENLILNYMRNEGKKLYVVVVVKRISTLSLQDVTHRFRRTKTLVRLSF